MAPWRFRARCAALVADGVDVAIDGVFATSTEKAVEEAQRMAGIAVDGVAGPTTWSALARP